MAMGKQSRHYFNNGVKDIKYREENGISVMTTF